MATAYHAFRLRRPRGAFFLAREQFSTRAEREHQLARGDFAELPAWYAPLLVGFLSITGVGFSFREGALTARFGVRTESDPSVVRLRFLHSPANRLIARHIREAK